MEVLILGCGPAGLIAAQAADAAGATVSIASKRTKSVMPGAQFIHEPIPGLVGEQGARTITFEKIGTREGYAAKVYGSPDAPCSWDEFPEGEVVAYPIGAIYDRLWEKWSPEVVNEVVDAEWLRYEISSEVEWDLIVSSIPAPAICHSRHVFRHQDIYITDHAWRGVGEDTIVYNGDTADHWYRSSKLFGHEYTESTIRTPTAVHGMKPLSNNCDCWQGKVLRIGRFGKWEKGVLVHHAYEEVTRALHQLQA